MDAFNPIRPALTVVPASSLDGDQGERTLAREVPVAVVFDGTTAAVMLASPQDIDDFALGFAVTEGFISGPDEISAFEIVSHDAGVEARFWLNRDASLELAARRRSMAGPVGCGLCGLDSLDAAARTVPKVDMGALSVSSQDVTMATTLLQAHQPLHDKTRAAHGAGLLVPEHGIVATREDVGRHNAVDKLFGALLREGIEPSTGALVLTSRISVELVQKAAVARCGMIIAVSAPTAYAVDVAQTAGITLVQSRQGSASIFTHPERIRSTHPPQTRGPTAP